MRTVSVKAINLRAGDVLTGVPGGRIKQLVPFAMRGEATGIMAITPHAKGYDIVTHKFRDKDRVSVRRPKFNMG